MRPLTTQSETNGESYKLVSASLALELILFVVTTLALLVNSRQLAVRQHFRALAQSHCGFF